MSLGFGNRTLQIESDNSRHQFDKNNKKIKTIL